MMNKDVMFVRKNVLLFDTGTYKKLVLAPTGLLEVIPPFPDRYITHYGLTIEETITPKVLEDAMKEVGVEQ
jgi:hypothetical protein